MAGEDVTLKLGGDADALVAATKQGGDAFAAFVQKSVNNAEELGKKLREVSGADVIAQAGQYAKAVEQIGGSTKLTVAEKTKLNTTLTAALEKYQALGIEAPAAMRKLAKETEPLPQKFNLINDAVGRLGPALVAAFTIAAVSKLIGNFTELTGRLVDLEGKTQINVVALHKMKLVLAESGVQLETAANASNMFQRRLAEGDNSALGALQRLGINLIALKAMKPEDQFFTIADAVGKVSDQGSRISLVNDLFGKQGQELLPALNGKLKETADAYQRMGLVLDEKVIRAGDQLGDQWTVLKSSGGALLGSVLGPIVPLLSTVAGGITKIVLAGSPLVSWLINVTMPFKRWSDSMDMATDALERLGVKALVLPKVHGEAADALNKSAKAAQSRLAVPLTMSLAEEEKVTKQLNDAIEKSIDKNTKAAAAAEAYRQKIDGLAERLSGRGVQKELADLRVAWSHLSEQERSQPENIRTIVAMYDALRSRVAPGALPRDLENLWIKAQAGFEKLQTIDIFGQLKFDTSLPAFIDPLRSFENDKKYKLKFEDIFTIDKTPPTAPLENWAMVMTGWAKQLPALIASSFTGGGGWEGALLASASTLGAAGLSKLFGKPGESGLLKNMNGILGDVLGAAVPVIGALIGPALSKLGKLFGVGINAEVKKANVEIDKVRQQLLATHGPMDQLEAKARALGLSFQANWGHQGQAGLKAFNELVKEFETRLAAANGKFGELFTSATNLGIALPAGLRASIQRLVDIGVITGDVAKQFAGLADQTGVDFKKMQAAAQRYGVDLGSLGTQFQGARLHASAQEIINDFDLLTRGGADVGGVLVGMKDEISALVVDSKKFGTEIPANMQPWIEELIRSGQLTDENGAKITSLEGMKFGDTVATEFEKITSALQDVVASLGQIASGIAGIPSHKTVTIAAEYSDEGPPPGFGEVDGESRGFAHGGLVRSPVRAWIAEGGEPELVGPVSFMTDALAGALRQMAVMERAVGPGPGLFPAPAPDIATAILGGLSSALRSGTSQGQAASTGSDAQETVNLTIAIDTLDTGGLELFIERKFLPAFTRTLERGRGLRDLQSALELH